MELRKRGERSKVEWEERKTEKSNKLEGAEREGEREGSKGLVRPKERSPFNGDNFNASNDMNGSFSILKTRSLTRLVRGFD